MSNPRKSEAQHWLEGTKVREGKSAPGPEIEAGRPKIPSHLCEEAKIEFRRCAKLLGRRGHETPGDVATLVIYAEIYSRWISTKRTLAAEGLIIDVPILDSNGAVHTTRKLNPLVRVVQADEGRLLALVRELGLSPISRSKVKPLKPVEKRHHAPGSVGELLEKAERGEETEFIQ